MDFEQAKNRLEMVAKEIRKLGLVCTVEQIGNNYGFVFDAEQDQEKISAVQAALSTPIQIGTRVTTQEDKPSIELFPSSGGTTENLDACISENGLQTFIAQALPKVVALRPQKQPQAATSPNLDYGTPTATISEKHGILTGQPTMGGPSCW